MRPPKTVLAFVEEALALGMDVRLGSKKQIADVTLHFGDKSASYAFSWLEIDRALFDCAAMAYHRLMDQVAR